MATAMGTTTAMVHASARIRVWRVCQPMMIAHTT
jgi:hypothetical protein